MAGIVVVFDFDRTLIDGDSDSWVVAEMGLTQLFNELRSTLPWNKLMVCTLSFSLRFIEKVQIFILWLIANKWVNFVNENDIFEHLTYLFCLVTDINKKKY